MDPGFSKGGVIERGIVRCAEQLTVKASCAACTEASADTFLEGVFLHYPVIYNRVYLHNEDINKIDMSNLL